MKVSLANALLSLLIIQEGGSQTEVPKLHDERLEIALIAEDPDIVTPIGLAIDAQNRLFVIESHTHHPPRDYQGPKSDRIKIFADKNEDGRFEDISIFAQGIHQAMNLAFSPTGTLYVVCAREVLALPDADGDGVCDGIEKILTLDTKQRYAHNSLLGITFDRDGWLYVSRGNTGSDAWAIRGKDGSEISGYGDGGNVFRCRPDGTRVEEVATGFWNPFSLKFNMEGRLLLVDNDPDARSPNRLVHVVQDGDYGYKSLYGGGGNHPFQGWDGSLPGTLPYIAGTGEAPCDLIDCRRTGFPRDYHTSVLASVWNENTIERFDLQAEAGTLTLKQKSVFLSGGKDFRPVALEADSHGNLFLTDWVLVAYPNHGRGRIWRIRAKDRAATAPKGFFDYPAVARINSTTPLTDIESASPFVRHAAIGRMTGGEAERGRRVFFTTTLMCSRCHSVDGAVSLLGPSLDGIARSVSRQQIIHSILRPSDQFPPQYQAWVVRTKDGVTHSGLQLDHKDGGAIELLGLNAETVRFEADEWEDYEASPASLMPPGLENLMPVADFRNLAAYLESLK